MDEERCDCVVCPSHRGSRCGRPAARLIAIALDPPHGVEMELRLRICDACYDEVWQELDRGAAPDEGGPASDL